MDEIWDNSKLEDAANRALYYYTSSHKIRKHCLGMRVMLVPLTLNAHAHISCKKVGDIRPLLME